MAVAHDADSNASSGASTVASLTWSHTTTGSNTLLVVGLTWTGNTVTMAITHAGNNPTGSTSIVQSTGTIYNSQIWWWVNPTTGAQNIIATPSGTDSIYGGGTSFTGVDQTNPILSAGSTLDARSLNDSSFGNVTEMAWASGQNEMIFNLIGMANATSTITAVSPATQSFNQFDATQNRTGGGEYWLATSNGFNAMSWTISGSSNRAWVMQSLAINPVGGVAVPHSKLNNSSLRPHLFSPGIAR